MNREQAEHAVDRIFKDLRGRRVLKWLFDEDPENCGPIADDIDPISLEVQGEIREAWIAILISSARPTTAEGEGT